MKDIVQASLSVFCVLSLLSLPVVFAIYVKQNNHFVFFSALSNFITIGISYVLDSNSEIDYIAFTITSKVQMLTSAVAIISVICYSREDNIKLYYANLGLTIASVLLLLTTSIAVIISKTLVRHKSREDGNLL